MIKLFCLSLLTLGVAFAQSPSLAAGPEILKSECIYIAGKKVKASAICTVKVYARATSATEEWEWNNGTRTVVKMSDEGILVNGQEAEKRDASEIIDVELDCLGIKATEEIYCR